MLIVMPPDTSTEPDLAGLTANRTAPARRTVVLIAALVIMTVAAASGWGVVIWLNASRPAPMAVGAKEPVELSPELTDTDSAIIEALERRNSTLGEDFTDKPLSVDVQSALAWAATGKNRGGTGFVVPLAMHSEPYVSVYLATDQGVARFDWETNQLAEIADADVRQELVTQGFAKQAPCLMLFVIDQDQVKGNEGNGYIAVGAMTQNVYLLADDLNIQARYVESIDHDQFRDKLGLSSSQVPVGAIVLAAK
jgi:hypothetical protein